MNHSPARVGSLASGLLLALTALGYASGAALAQQGEQKPVAFPQPTETWTATPEPPSSAIPSALGDLSATPSPSAFTPSPSSAQEAVPPTLMPPPAPSVGESRGVGGQPLSAIVPAPAHGWFVATNISHSAVLSDWPAAAVGPDGSVFVVWAEGPIGSREIYYATNFGGSWSTPQIISGSPSIDSYAPDVALDSDGGANIVWQEGAHEVPTKEVLFTRCVGANCSPAPTIVSNGRCSIYPGNWASWMPSIVVGEDGLAMLTWMSQEPGGNRFPYVVWRPPDPAPTVITGCAPPPYSGGFWMPDLASAPFGQRRLVFEDYLNSRIYHGRYASGTWAPSRFVGNGNTPRVIVDAGDRSHIIWCYVGSVNYLFGDGITAWSPQEAIAADQGCGGPPAAAIRWDGLVHAVWEGWTHGVQVLQSIRTESGWTTPENVSQSVASADDPALVADAQGYLHLLWADSREGNVEILYSKRTPAMYPYTSIVQGQGFDILSAPDTDHLAAWWNAPSPYKYVGIYFGGSTRWDQKQLKLEEEGWFAEVASQGWQFIPIWAGPMRPCRHEGEIVYDHFHTDPVLAEEDGREQARLAVEEAFRFGLVGPAKDGTIIYYDFEPPDKGKDCTAALRGFVTGWVSELNQLGNAAGVYAIAEDVMSLTDFDGSEPDAMWIANYYPPPYAYNDKASVWDITHNAVPTTVWNDHNRLRQYAGTHAEPHGGVRLRSIDSNVADGPVAVVPGAMPIAQVPSALAPRLPSPSAEAVSSQVHAMKLLTASDGWIWMGDQLLWTHTGGATWENITPGALSDKATMAVDFLDPSSGWLISAEWHDVDGTVQLHTSRTTSGGHAWTTQPMLDPAQTGSPAEVHMDFIDPLNGWVVVRQQTSSNASDGFLFHTDDGGDSWMELTIPSGNPVRFVTPLHGWTLGGPGSDMLYETVDGGLSWTERPVIADADWRYNIYGLPTFTSALDGVLPIMGAEVDQTDVWFFVTHDGGAMWIPGPSEHIDQYVGPVNDFPIEVIDLEHFVLPTSGGLSGQAGAVAALSFISPDVGWAVTGDGNCQDTGGQVNCNPLSALLSTGDGGDTWQEIALPLPSLYLPIIMR